MKYTQLTLEKRYQISALIKAGLSQKDIAFELEVHPSTISRELRRNRDLVRGYNAELAQIKSTKKEMQKKKRCSLTKAIQRYIRAKLKLDWSPEQIAGRMRLDTDFYFANPYHSWERGLNEHTNGLIRQYLPKKSTFTDVSKDEIIMIQNRLNHRPRKVLNYKTPYEVFFSEMGRRLAS